MTLLVGVGGGVPLAQPVDDPTKDVYLGDVVVGWPGDGDPAYVCYESIMPMIQSRCLATTNSCRISPGARVAQSCSRPGITR